MPFDNHKGDIQHSLYGMSWGLDGRKLGVIGSPALGTGGDLRYGTETITSTLPSTLSPAATSILAATGTAAYELVSPSASMVGVRKRLLQNSAGAAQAMLVKLTAGNFVTLVTSGSSNNTITLSTRGSYVDLEYISTSLVFAMITSTVSTAYVSFSTTT